MDELNGIIGNKIKPSIGEYRRSDLRQYYYQRSKGNSLLIFTIQRRKDLHRMHRGLHEFPIRLKVIYQRRVLDNVCRVLEPLGNTLKGSRCLRRFGNIRKCRVMIYERGE
jgi:hypothetical protein